MTPIYKVPARVDSEGHTRVFHRDHPGRIVVTFHGPNHWQDAREFCERYGEDDGSKRREREQ